MDVMTFLKCNALSTYSSLKIVIHSRFFQRPKKRQNNNLKNNDLETCSMLGQNHGPFTLIIVMRPPASLARC